MHKLNARFFSRTKPNSQHADPAALAHFLPIDLTRNSTTVARVSHGKCGGYVGLPVVHSFPKVDRTQHEVLPETKLLARCWMVVRPKKGSAAIL